MQMTEYFDQGPIKIPVELDLTKLVGKSVIVTGG